MEIKSNEENKTQETITEVDVSENHEDIELNSENVHKLFQACSLKDEEIKDGYPTVDFNFVDGITYPFIFTTERLNENKMKIAKLIDMLPISSIPQTFLRLRRDKNNRLWTEDQQMVELLMVLGIACGLIEYTFPREKWQGLLVGVPSVNKTKKDLSEVIVGESPEAFSKYIPEEVKKKH